MTDQADIVERLEREVAEHNGMTWPMDAHERAFVKDDLRMQAAAEIQRLRAALAAERERCAKVADKAAQIAERMGDDAGRVTALTIATAIRDGEE